MTTTPLTPEEIKKLPTADLIKRMNELRAEVGARPRTARTTPPEPHRPNARNRV